MAKADLAQAHAHNRLSRDAAVRELKRGLAGMLIEFDRILPSAITEAAVRNGNEWVIPFPEVKHAVNLASEHLFAVLGVESFRILGDGVGVESYTGYDFSVQGDWPAYVLQNNDAALRFIEETQLGKGYGYILTTCSEDEFKNLERQNSFDGHR